MAMFVQQSPRRYLEKCLTCPVIRRGLCCDASPDAQRALSQASSRVSYGPGEEIIVQGVEEEHVGIVLSGTVKISNIAVDGRKTVIALLESGNIVGNLLNGPSRFSYEAADQTTICRIRKDQFRTLLWTYPDLGYRVLELTTQHAELVEEWLTLFNCRTTLQRVAGYLVAVTTSQMTHQADKRNIDIEFPIGRKDLAAYLGTTPETLSRNFSHLASLQILTVSDGRHVVVHSLRRLKEIAGEAPGVRSPAEPERFTLPATRKTSMSVASERATPQEFRLTGDHNILRLVSASSQANG
ncbi:MAG TPA: Crp/Fnr family transcriptional regulator [Ensifer sp.]|nr:Crp/Fnr family transcriptional regulator [Ensifer sp.]